MGHSSFDTAHTEGRKRRGLSEEGSLNVTYGDVRRLSEVFCTEVVKGFLQRLQPYNLRSVRYANFPARKPKEQNT